MLYGVLNRLALACATAGFAIASVITAAHIWKTPLPCGRSGGCDRVAHDPSSFYMGIPVSVFGMAAYTVLIVAAILRIRGIALRRISFVGFFVSALGLIVSVVLTSYSIVKIHATCAWCLGSGSMMLLSTVAYLATPNASKGIKDSGKPVSAWPWGLAPIPIVALIAVLGHAIKPKAPDLSSINLSRISYSELESSSRPLGQKDARVTIVEFADLMCPACQDMHQRLLMFLIHNKGKVRLMYHHFPLVGLEEHEQSEYAADLSEQLNADEFWGFVGKVYGSEERPDRAKLDKIFAGFHGARAKSEKTAKDDVAHALKIGQDYGIRDTPTYILFIDKKPVAAASNVDIQEVIRRPEFAAIFAPNGPKAK